MEGAGLMHMIGLFFENGQSLLSLVNCRMQVIYVEIVRLVHEAHEHLLHKIYERYFTRLLPRGREGLLRFGSERLYPKKV